MEDISKLIREAKPLYFARKRRNKRIVTTVCMLVCVWFFGQFYPQPDLSINYSSLDEEIFMTENGSVIEDMGLPIDEYGLLMVG